MNGAINGMCLQANIKKLTLLLRAGKPLEDFE